MSSVSWSNNTSDVDLVEQYYFGEYIYIYIARISRVARWRCWSWNSSLATPLMVVRETSSFNLLKLRITGRWLWREQKAIVADCVCLFSRPAKWTASPRAGRGRRRLGGRRRHNFTARRRRRLSRRSLSKEDRSVKCNFPPFFLSLFLFCLILVRQKRISRL